jgi:hypothetical protein
LSSQLDRKTVWPFAGVAGLWLALCIAISLKWAGAHAAGAAAAWAGALWGLCLLDLYSLARAVGAALELASTEGENRGALIIQAFYWGVIKLTCLGILGAILLHGRSIPMASVVSGFGTMVVVPLVGGYRWSQKVLRHA